ncbi:uncharacterized protein LOC108205861 [Daucus carota subsp. sativus]|nr:PREDICTED: uncharacterized protein LOC108205861 [Daucus carota subsp. sativus]XP_017231457.1 PREDICTED: uncharacterized protein LOC108205861 [Daucus carota subsp. sativus]XP_017231458.1 PREDICTED: uncharacterized protein LOC108205861 [Daucus carota subsp. sativus]XP_017231459.1 PREDICTED: uncharacterized protein LOC108205861 [Daucus carota subsp. sativus]
MEMEKNSSSNTNIWSHLDLLMRAKSKESLEYILQALWRTRNTGLDATDRRLFCEILDSLPDSQLDPLLVCLRMLIRQCVQENVSKDEIHKLFPAEVSIEMQRLLTLLLQKFHSEWREDIQKDRSTLPRYKNMSWKMENQGDELMEPRAVINLKLQSNVLTQTKETNVAFQLAKDNLNTMMQSMYSIRDQLSDAGGMPHEPLQQPTDMV